jgi:hypothetical protein
MNPQVEAAKVALQKLFQENRYFDISIVDRLLKITNSIPDAKDYEILQAIHCCYYNRMTGEFRAWVQQTVIEMLNGNGFKVELIDETKFTPVVEIKVSKEKETAVRKIAKFLKLPE